MVAGEEEDDAVVVVVVVVVVAAAADGELVEHAEVDDVSVSVLAELMSPSAFADFICEVESVASVDVWSETISTS